jgi:hypothetical protein
MAFASQSDLNLCLAAAWWYRLGFVRQRWCAATMELKVRAQERRGDRELVVTAPRHV